MIAVEGVTKYYLNERVLDDVTLRVPEGHNLGLIGPGASGKTLLTKVITGLVEPDAGRVLVDGVDVHRLNKVELGRFRLKFGMLFQNYALFDFMTVGENIAFPLRREGGRSEAEIGERVAGLLEKVDLPGIENLEINELSGGMKKRVSFARAIVRNPPILIYDDPTAGLDPVTSSKIFILLKDIRDRFGTTSITISHDLAGMREVCDLWAMLEKGRLLFFGTAEEIERCQDPHVRDFWEGVRIVPL